MKPSTSIMNSLSLRKWLGALLLGFGAFALSGWAHADPPSRVARLAYLSGTVSFSPAGENDWVRANVNRPLISGDRLWSDSGARGELQMGAAAIRMGSRTSMTLLNVDDRIAQVQLTQGTLNIRIWRFERNQVFEVNTPNLAYSIRSPGSYRIEVDPRGDSTIVMVRSGQAEVFGEGRAFMIEAGQGFEFFDTGLRDYDSFALAPADDFDRWASTRDQRWENSVSARYVSRDLIGYEDLDEYGTWRDVAGYGPVWMPTRVAADWAPYRDGHWAWVEPWGWTWVDDAPWGFAPSHYGRWANFGGSWGWVPGPREARPVYAPALVAFVGGSSFNISLNLGGGGAVAWFPLGPRDVYRPAYAVSRDYFTSVNTSNTVINTVNIINVYNNTNVTNVTYVNQQVPGAVVAVPATAFVQSRSVAREAVRVSRDMAATSPVMAVAPLAPIRTSVMGSAPPAARPPEATVIRPLVARSAPPPAPAPFAARQGALAANPGKPLDAAATAALRPATPAPAASVTIATPPPAATVPPPPSAPNVSRNERRQAAEEERSRRPVFPQRPDVPQLGAQPAVTPAAPAPEVMRPAEAVRPQRPSPSTPPVAAPAPSIAAPVPPAAAVAAPAAQEERVRRGRPQGRVPPDNRPPAEASIPAPRPVPAAPPVFAPAPPVVTPVPAAQEERVRRGPPQGRPQPPENRAPAEAAMPAAAGAEAPGRRQRPDAARSADRREPASEAKRGEEQRRRADEDQGRRP